MYIMYFWLLIGIGILCALIAYGISKLYSLYCERKNEKIILQSYEYLNTHFEAFKKELPLIEFTRKPYTANFNNIKNFLLLYNLVNSTNFNYKTLGRLINEIKSEMVFLKELAPSLKKVDIQYLFDVNPKTKRISDIERYKFYARNIDNRDILRELQIYHVQSSFDLYEYRKKYGVVKNQQYDDVINSEMDIVKEYLNGEKND